MYWKSCLWQPWPQLTFIVWKWAAWTFCLTSPFVKHETWWCVIWPSFPFLFSQIEWNVKFYANFSWLFTTKRGSLVVHPLVECYIYLFAIYLSSSSHQLQCSRPGFASASSEVLRLCYSKAVKHALHSDRLQPFSAAICKISGIFFHSRTFPKTLNKTLALTINV